MIGREIEYAKLIEPVARELLGDPNPLLTTPKELRYGTNGSVSIDLGKGVWHDHEANEGGGVLALIKRETGLSNGAAAEWLSDKGFTELPRSEPLRAPKVVAVYPYTDEGGALLFEVCRCEPKTFRQRRPDGSGGWIWKLGDTRRVLYRLPELVAAPADALVFLTEGEKDADRLAALGLTATTNPGGGGSWRPEYTEMLQRRRVAILPDNDQKGRVHAKAVKASLDAAGVRAAILELEGLPEKGDVSDWLDRGGDPTELVRRAEAALTPISPTPFVVRDPALIPPRQWLYARHMVRRFCSVTVSQGGVGKSSLLIVEALAMATGRRLLGVAPPEPLRVWLWNGEDPADEVERRIAAACIHYGVTAGDIEGRLFTDSGRDLPLEIAIEERGGIKIATPLVDDLIETLKRNRIDVLIIDPFVTSHGVSENDNRAINVVASQWRGIADAANAAVELVHHVRKGQGGAAYSIDDARGAKALIDAARSARVLNPMTEDEAEKAGLETHHGYFRVENGKANMAPRSGLGALQGSAWRRMTSVALGNGSDLYPTGDEVGVVEAWQLPDAFEGIDLTHLKAVQDRLASGDWRANEQANRWAGYAVAEVLGVDIGEWGNRTREQKAARARVKIMLRDWLRSGALVRETRHSRRTVGRYPSSCPASP